VSFPYTGTGFPFGLAIAPDCTFALVANYSGDNIGRIDLITNKVTFHADICNPNGIAISPDGTFALVTSTSSRNITHVDLGTYEVVFTYGWTTEEGVSLGFKHPNGVSIAPDGTFAFVVNNTSNTVGRINLFTRTLTFPYSGFSGPNGIAISPDGTFALVACGSSHKVGRIDLVTDEVTFPYAGFNVPCGVSIAPDGTFALVANYTNNTVDRIDLVTHEVTPPFAGFSSPTCTAISPDGAFALAANYNGNSVGRIDGDIRAGFNTGAVWQGRWCSEMEHQWLPRNLWKEQWGGGFVHPPTPGTAADVRQAPTALAPRAEVPQAVPSSANARLSKRAVVCMAPGCKPRTFGFFTRRHTCTLCHSAVCTKCLTTANKHFSPWGGVGDGGFRHCHACQQLVDSPRWPIVDASRFADAVKAEADGIPLVVQTLAGDQHVVAGGSGWATATDLLRFVVSAVPALQALGGAEQLALMAGSVAVDPHFYTSEVRARMVRGEIPATVVVVVVSDG
jgi:sugar lactone lactonase YvrE